MSSKVLIPISFAEASTTLQIAQSPNSSPRMRPPFDSGRKWRPLSIFAATCQASIPCFHPNRYRDRSDPTALALQVHDDPPALTLLNIFQLQRGEFSASQHTSDQERQNAVIALAFDRDRSGTASNSFACSRVSQFPIRLPFCLRFGTSAICDACSASRMVRHRSETAPLGDSRYLPKGPPGGMGAGTDRKVRAAASEGGGDRSGRQRNAPDSDGLDPDSSQPLAPGNPSSASQRRGIPRCIL
jgi:hypothetical protein